MVMVFDGEITGLLTTFQKARGTNAHGDNNSESDDAMIYTFLSRNNVQTSSSMSASIANLY